MMMKNEEIARRIRALHPRLVDLRRDLHRHPELGFEEVRTSQVVVDWCEALGLLVRKGVAKTGVVARLTGNTGNTGSGAGKTIALRADMDALPIQDAKVAQRCSYASEVPNKMHACGHDAHVAMALGAATILSQMRDALEGNVVFLFQPAEEGPGGAAPMIAEGALEGVDFIVGQHMGPMLATGEIGISEGRAMAAADFFTLKVVGRGGHGAYPHLAVDTVPIAAEIVTGLQSIVARNVDPLQPAVVTIGTIHGGYRSNVIADCVDMTGTVRTFDAVVRDDIVRRIETISSEIARAHGAVCTLEYAIGYPAVINHKGAVSLVRRTAMESLGSARVHTVAPSMGGEDFAHYLHKVPGCFYWLGCRTPGVAEMHNIHHPGFDLDEEALVYGVTMFVKTALSFLGARSQGATESVS
ncbi:MAG: amidohydrolase [Polyangiales bacterium]